MSTIAVLPLRDDDVLLGERHRVVAGSWMWEIPRGAIDPGETDHDAALRELGEETGIGPNDVKLEKLGTYWPDDDRIDAAVPLYLARVNPGTSWTGSNEFAQLGWFHKDLVAAMIGDDRITDGFTIAAFAKAKFTGLLD
jgi:8-oxo-dGTP pyrophosphatase MutT (NUDIX family)